MAAASATSYQQIWSDTPVELANTFSPKHNKLLWNKIYRSSEVVMLLFPSNSFDQQCQKYKIRNELSEMDA